MPTSGVTLRMLLTAEELGPELLAKNHPLPCVAREGCPGQIGGAGIDTGLTEQGGDLA